MFGSCSWLNSLSGVKDGVEDRRRELFFLSPPSCRVTVHCTSPWPLWNEWNLQRRHGLQHRGRSNTWSCVGGSPNQLQSLPLFIVQELYGTSEPELQNEWQDVICWYLELMALMVVTAEPGYSSLDSLHILISAMVPAVFWSSELWPLLVV